MRTPHMARARSYEVFGKVNPRFSAAGNAELARAKVAELQRFDADYDVALAGWEAGNRKVLFPYGTWWMRVHHKVRVRPPPWGPHMASCVSATGAGTHRCVRHRTGAAVASVGAELSRQAGEPECSRRAVRLLVGSHCAVCRAGDDEPTTMLVAKPVLISDLSPATTNQQRYWSPIRSRSLDEPTRRRRRTNNDASRQSGPDLSPISLSSISSDLFSPKPVPSSRISRISPPPCRPRAHRAT